MKRLDQKGFTPFEIVLLVLVVAVLGFAGYVVLQKDKPAATNQDTPSSQKQEKTESKVKAELPSGFSKQPIADTGLVLAYPTIWGEAKKVSMHGETWYELNGMNLELYKDTEVKIKRSINAPSYCAYVTINGSWAKSGEYPPQSCEPSVLNVSGVKAEGFSRGALGAYGFTYGANLKGDKYLLFLDAIISNGTAEQDPEAYPSAADSAKLKDDLGKNVEIIIKNNVALFEGAN